jgi:hypothetical protein
MLAASLDVLHDPARGKNLISTLDDLKRKAMAVIAEQSHTAT